MILYRVLALVYWSRQPIARFAVVNFCVGDRRNVILFFVIIYPEYTFRLLLLLLLLLLLGGC